MLMKIMIITNKRLMILLICVPFARRSLCLHSLSSHCHHTQHMKTAWSANSAEAGVTTTGNVTTVTTAVKVPTETAIASTTAENAESVWKMAVCATIANSASNAVNARTNVADAMRLERPSARIAARNAPDVHGYAITARNVWIAWVTRCIAPTAIYALTARIGSATAVKDAQSVRLDARIATKNVQNAHQASFVLHARHVSIAWAV